MQFVVAMFAENEVNSPPNIHGASTINVEELRFSSCFMNLFMLTVHKSGRITFTPLGEGCTGQWWGEY